MYQQFSLEARHIIRVFDQGLIFELADTIRTTEPPVCGNDGQVVIASASSISDIPEGSSDDANATIFGPQNAVNGILMFSSAGSHVTSLDYYQSALYDSLPWIQIDHGCSTPVIMVLVASIYDLDDGAVRSIRVLVGNSPAAYGQMHLGNQVCHELIDPIEPQQYGVLHCQKVLWGRYVVVQMTQKEDPDERLAINEVKIFTALMSTMAGNGILQY